MYTTATMPDKGASAATTSQKGSEPVKLLERIGSTTVEVSIHFSKTSKETMEDKILRLLRDSREIEDFVGRGGATERSGFPPQGGSSRSESATTRREANENAS